MNQFHNRISLTVALAGALALAACGKSTPPPAPPATTPPATAPASQAATPGTAPTYVARITSVTLTNALDANGKVTTPATTFTPKDTIYGVVSADAGKPDATIIARWTFEGGQLVSEQVETLKEPGPNTSAFHISKPDGFPAGNYTLDILVDGKPVSTTNFSVK